MDQFITDIRPYLEVLYFLSGVALAIGLALTYKQLALLKADVLNRSQRAAAERAIEASDLYFGQYISLTKAYFDAKQQNKIKSYKGPVGDFSYTSLPNELKAECIKRLSLREWLPALNRLESIAARFTSGVADESVGFKIFGRTFCATVEDQYDLIALSRREAPFGYWSNIVELYKTWSPRLTRAELAVARDALDAKLSSMQTHSIPPI
jgi:hypothetical protein